MKKLFSLMLCLALLLSICSGCAAEDKPYVPTGGALAAEDADLDMTEPAEEETLQELSMAFYPNRSLNPFSATDYTNRALFSLIYQGLFSINSDYEAVPILCRSYSVSADYKSYTFYITSATFSDGTAVSIEDVLASFQAAQASDYYGGRFTHVQSIELSGDGGIRFGLYYAMENLELLLDVPIVKAEEVEAERPLGTGPYILEDTLQGTQLRKNMSWWCQEHADLIVTAESIPLYEAESSSDIRDQFEFYDVDLVCADPCSDDYADYRGDYELWDCENGIMVYLGCNVTYSRDGIFENTKVRSAITYAINREQLVADYYRGFARAATLAASPQSPYYSSGLAAKYDYDPLEFIEAMSGVTLPSEPLVLLVNKDDSLRLRTARAIAEMLTDSGLPTQVTAVNTRVYQKMIVAGNYDLYLGQTKLSANMDLSPFFKVYGNLSRNGIADSALFSRCLEALENSGNYYSLLKSVADDGRIIPILFCSYGVFATRGLLTDLQPSRDNVYFYTLGRTVEQTREQLTE